MLDNVGTNNCGDVAEQVDYHFTKIITRLAQNVKGFGSRIAQRAGLVIQNMKNFRGGLKEPGKFRPGRYAVRTSRKRNALWTL